MNKSNLKIAISNDCSKYLIINNYLKHLQDGEKSISSVAFIIDATLDITPEFRENILFSCQAGIENILIILNNCDLIDNKLLDLYEKEIRNILNDYLYNDIPIIRCSKIKKDVSNNYQDAFDALKEHYDKCVESDSKRTKVKRKNNRRY